MGDSPKPQPQTERPIDTAVQRTPEQITEELKQRESAIVIIQNTPELGKLDGVGEFTQYLKQANISDVQQFIQLVQHLKTQNRLSTLISMLDSSSGDGFPNGTTLKFSDIFKSFQKDLAEAKDKAAEAKDKAAEEERSKLFSETFDILDKSAPNSLKVLRPKLDAAKSLEEKIKILRDNQDLIRQELFTEGKKDGFKTYERVANNFRTLRVIDDSQYLRWIEATKAPLEGGAQPPKPEMAFGGYERHGDTFIKPGTDGGPSMMIADGKVMCIGKEGFKLSSYFPNQEMEQQYLTYRQNIEKLSNEKIQKEALAKDLGSILEKLGPITVGVTPEDFVQRITEAGPFNNPQVKEHFADFLQKNPNMRREDKIKSILNAVLRFAGVKPLYPSMDLWQSLGYTRGQLGEKNKQTTERVKQIDSELAQLSKSEIGKLGTEQERKEQIMMKTVKFVEALGLDCFGSRADIERLLQRFTTTIKEKAGDGFAPDIGPGEAWMGEKSIQTLCTIISTITGITPNELYNDTNLIPPTLKTTLSGAEAGRLMLPPTISVRDAIKARLDTLGVVRGGIFNVDRARSLYDAATLKGREADERKAEQAEAARLAGNTEKPTSDYPVQSGDNLTRIARRFGISLKDLLELNPEKKKNPDFIRVGETIKVPKKPEAPKPAEAPAK